MSLNIIKMLLKTTSHETNGKAEESSGIASLKFFVYFQAIVAL